MPMPLELFVEDDGHYCERHQCTADTHADARRSRGREISRTGYVWVDGFNDFTTTKGGKILEPYAGKAEGNVTFYAAGRLHRARHHPGHDRQGRRRVGLLLDDRDGQGQRQVSSTANSDSCGRDPSPREPARFDAPPTHFIANPGPSPFRPFAGGISHVGLALRENRPQPPGAASTNRLRHLAGNFVRRDESPQPCEIAEFTRIP